MRLRAFACAPGKDPKPPREAVVFMAGATKAALHGQVAIVTGSGRGIGAAIAGRLAGMGALTFLCGRRRAPLEGTAAAIVRSGGRGENAEGDGTDMSSGGARAG